MILMVGWFYYSIVSLSPLAHSITRSFPGSSRISTVRSSFVRIDTKRKHHSFLSRKVCLVRSVIAIGIMDTFAMTDHIFFGI